MKMKTMNARQLINPTLGKHQERLDPPLLGTSGAQNEGMTEPSGIRNYADINTKESRKEQIGSESLDSGGGIQDLRATGFCLEQSSQCSEIQEPEERTAMQSFRRRSTDGEEYLPGLPECAGHEPWRYPTFRPTARVTTAAWGDRELLSSPPPVI